MNIDWNEILGQFIGAVLPIVVTVVTALLGLAAVSIRQLIAVKVANETVAGILTRLNDTVWLVVGEIQRIEVEALQEATSPESPGGRKITRDEAERLANIALERVREYLGADGLATLMFVLGLKTEVAANRFLRGRIQAAFLEHEKALPLKSKQQ